MKYALWIIQGLLAALFIFAGVTKLVMPIEAMTKEMAMPGLLLRFIGVCEILGGLGLVLPAWLGIRPGLTSLAAIGLLILMLGAIVITVLGPHRAQAAIPVMVALLLGFVVWGRQRLRRTSSRDG
ncbi:MAG: DoxX family protein [Chthoniobacterales bacterium]|nr:DoxX family protein [Chthoniobacterales bacterium]